MPDLCFLMHSRWSHCTSSLADNENMVSMNNWAGVIYTSPSIPLSGKYNAPYIADIIYTTCPVCPEGCLASANIYSFPLCSACSGCRQPCLLSSASRNTAPSSALVSISPLDQKPSNGKMAPPSALAGISPLDHKARNTIITEKRRHLARWPAFHL